MLVAAFVIIYFLNFMYIFTTKKEAATVFHQLKTDTFTGARKLLIKKNARLPLVS